MEVKVLFDSIHIFSIPHRTYGLEFGATMTVIPLKSGKLWIHSPLPLTEDLVGKVSQLGEVAYLVAPNHFHHLYIKEWKERFPRAQAYGSKGLQKKKKDFRFDLEIPTDFEGEIESFLVAGAPMLEERVFFLRNRKTLLTTDLVLNIPLPVGLWTRFYLWVSGMVGKPGTSPLIKWLMKDKKESRRSLQQLLSLDFDHLLLAHGPPVLNEGKKVLEKSYQWLLKP